jgi:hypothetical protein
MAAWPVSDWSVDDPKQDIRVRLGGRSPQTLPRRLLQFHFERQLSASLQIELATLR